MPYESYKVDNPSIKSLLRNLAHRLAQRMPIGWGFTLFIFEYGAQKACFYISSAQRSDMISTVKEWLREQGETEL